MLKPALGVSKTPQHIYRYTNRVAKVEKEAKDVENSIQKAQRTVYDTAKLFGPTPFALKKRDRYAVIYLFYLRLIKEELFSKTLYKQQSYYINLE